jgi:hypothetical protein
MTIAYSGFNGIDGEFGKESITITGATTVPVLMEAYAYDVGVVNVTYAWSATETACCLKTAACTGSFEKTVNEVKGVATLGDIPAGVKDLYIELSTTGDDLDIQLFDTANNNTVIVGYELGAITGLGDKSIEDSADYGACTYAYSGYNGVGGDFGNEWIRITCTTDRVLTMKVA